MSAGHLRLQIYHAVVNVGDPGGVHHRVKITAESADEALRLLKREFGEPAIIRFWRDGDFPIRQV